MAKSLEIVAQRTDKDPFYEVNNTQSYVALSSITYGGLKWLPKGLAMAVNAGGKLIVYDHTAGAPDDVCIGFLLNEVIMDGVNDMDAVVVVSGVVFASTDYIPNWNVGIESCAVWAGFRKANTI